MNQGQTAQEKLDELISELRNLIEKGQDSEDCHLIGGYLNKKWFQQTEPVRKWVLTVTVNDQLRVSIHDSEEQAKEELAFYVQQAWDVHMDGSRMPDDEEDAIESFFAWTEERYSIERAR